jgi:DtxR family Mn-dependent transcriptional regulator
MNKIALTSTLEDYLEAIYQISNVNKVARSMDIAEHLKVKRSSVTVALQSLAEKGLINYHALHTAVYPLPCRIHHRRQGTR